MMTEIPNIVFELVRDKEISASEFALYCIYRKIASEGEPSFVSTGKLAEMANMSKSTIANAKKALSKPFNKLGGKSLIQITLGDKKLKQADIVLIVDIWPENEKELKPK
jgi:hypothetical protein